MVQDESVKLVASHAQEVLFFRSRLSLKLGTVGALLDHLLEARGQVVPRTYRKLCGN